MTSSRKPTSAKDWPMDGEALQAMYEAVTELNLWEKLAALPDNPQQNSIFYSQLIPIYEALYSHPKVIAIKGSGASDGFYLGVMRSIAKKGFEAYLAGFGIKDGSAPGLGLRR